MTSLNNEHSYSVRSVRNGMIAGYAAGITGIIVGHPLDSIKVLLQTQTNGGSGCVSSTRSASSSMSSTSVASSVQARNMSTIAAVSPAAPSQTAANSLSTQGSLIGKRSLRALYSGVTGPLLTTGILQSLNFAIYDSVRRVLYQHQLLQSSDMCNSVQPDDYLHHDNLTSVAMASFAAGATTSVLTSPMIIVKTKQQLMVWGFRKAIRDTYHSGFKRQPHFINGLSNFYTGFGLHFFCDAIGRGLYMYSYELLKRQLAKAKCNDEEKPMFSQFSFKSMNDNIVSTANLSIPDRMVCAALSGMICWAFIYPADVIRSKVYAKSLNAQTSLTTLDGINLARTMVRENGFKSLYRGMGVTVLRAGPVAASVLPVYDSVLEWMSSS